MKMTSIGMSPPLGSVHLKQGNLNGECRLDNCLLVTLKETLLDGRILSNETERPMKFMATWKIPTTTQRAAADRFLSGGAPMPEGLTMLGRGPHSGMGQPAGDIGHPGDGGRGRRRGDCAGGQVRDRG